MSTLTSEIILVQLTTLIKDCQNNIRGDFLGGPVAKTALHVRGSQVQSPWSQSLTGHN